MAHSALSEQLQVLIVVFGDERSGSNVVFETVASVRPLTWSAAECLFAESGQFDVDMGPQER